MQYRTWLLLAFVSTSACASQPPPAAAANAPGPNPHAAHHGPQADGKGPGMMGGGMMGGGMMGGGMMGQGDMKEMCPAEVPGTTAQAEEPEGGAALSFKTSGDVAEVRRRVARMAEMHNRHQPSADGKSGGGMMGGGMMGGGMMGGGMMGGGMMMPPSQARAEDIDGGARLVFTPQKAEDLQALRDKVKKHAADMAGHTCPMMKTAEAAPVH